MLEEYCTNRGGKVRLVMVDRSIAWKSVLALVLLAALSGCAVRYAVVREEHFRSEVGRRDRIQLPLSEESARELLEFVKADGDRTRMHKAEANLNAGSDYGSLLKALQNPQNLAASTNKPAKQFCQTAVAICGQTRLFRGRPAVMDVIDAREPGPVFPYPIAVSDGRFWWIFYHRRNQGEDRFQELLVTRTAIRKRP
jgi:hypothetical protein